MNLRVVQSLLVALLVIEATSLQITHHACKSPNKRVESIRERYAVKGEIILLGNLHVNVDSNLVDFLRSLSCKLFVVVVCYLEDHSQPDYRKISVVQPVKVIFVVEVDDALIRYVVVLDAILFQHCLQCLGIDRSVFHQSEGVVVLPKFGFKSNDEPDETGY